MIDDITFLYVAGDMQEMFRYSEKSFVVEYEC